MRLASIAGTAALLLTLSGVTNAQTPTLPTLPPLPLVIDNVDLVNPQLVHGVLTAKRGTISGTLLDLPFTTQLKNFSLDLTPAANTGGGVCGILDLEIAPIHLQLLGLHVDTSRICLNITAIDNGGILGSLLCDLAGLNLNDLLGQLLDGGLLGEILGGSLGSILNTAPAGGGGGGNGKVCTGKCEVLDLVLGPVFLNVLGLVVDLDNCKGGPVEVCVSSTASEGILGSLLCSLTGPGLLSLADITQLIDLAQSLLADGSLSLADIAQLTTLLNTLLGVV